MRQQPILILQLDERAARSLSESLSEHFGLTQVVTSLDDALPLLVQSPSSVLIADLEAASPADVSNLTAQFPAALVVCIHRTPDDFMWVRAVNAGADDCCASTDLAGIVRAISVGTRLRASAA
jgi:DNA-binding NtrC family response regulator